MHNFFIFFTGVQPQGREPRHQARAGQGHLGRGG